MLTRRGILHAAGATGASFVSGRAGAAPSTVKTPVGFAVPPGACDCHVHVFSDPQKFPFAPDRVYTPPQAWSTTCARCRARSASRASSS
jgi:hypothetical protein